MMPLEETLNIDTPENVTFDYDIAGIGSRFIAALIDTLIILTLQVITNLLILLLISQNVGIHSITDLSSLEAWMIALIGMISFLFLWGYYIFFELLWNGQTPGKRAVRLRVIRSDGTPITLTEAMVRNLVRLADFLPAFYGVGTIAIFVNRQSRRLGDLAAGTLVVREKNTLVTLNDLAALHMASHTRVQSAEPTHQTARNFPVERLNYQDIQMVESFFQRKKELVNASLLAAQLLNRLLAKMDVQGASDGMGNDEATLQMILKEYRLLNRKN